jgi:hypothetical protein
MNWSSYLKDAYLEDAMYQIMKRRMRSFERVQDSPISDKESEALDWAQQYLESHRDTLDHARESIGVVRESDLSSFNKVI